MVKPLSKSSSPALIDKRLLVLPVAILVSFIGCSEDDPPPPAPLDESKTIPVEVKGYGSEGNCRDPSCVEVARACHDVVASGCGSIYAPKDAQGARRPTPRGSVEFDAAVRKCTDVVFLEVSERARKAVVDSATATARVRAMRRGALEVASCTRLAKDCATRAACLRWMFTRPPSGLRSSDIPEVDAAPPPKPPPWTEPWSAAANPAWPNPPWGDAGVSTISGVDSPSCVRCAVERCPTIAYFCFGAEGDPQACPNGDCCQAYRACIESCGGYEPNASPHEFYRCADACEIGRPSAPQQLADLQHCAEQACAGCERHDKAYRLGPDGGLEPVPGQNP